MEGYGYSRMTHKELVSAFGYNPLEGTKRVSVSDGTVTLLKPVTKEMCQ